MFEKTNISFIVLHIYIITYLIVTIVEVPENVMLAMHIISPFVVITTLYFILKTFNYSSSSSLKEEKSEEYKVL